MTRPTVSVIAVVNWANDSAVSALVDGAEATSVLTVRS
jgi:hypothetical protein